MPTKRERELLRAEMQHKYKVSGYDEGYKEGYREGYNDASRSLSPVKLPLGIVDRRKPKRKLSAWNKFVKANSKKPRFVLRSGKLNLKKMGVAFRKTPAGRKKKRR